MQDKNFIKLTDQDAALLEQGASMLEGLENDERNRGNCSTAEGAECSAHAVRRLASALLAHEREIGQCLHQIQEPAAAEQAAWHAGLDEGRAQAAPAAVAMPDELIRAAKQALACMDGLQQHLGRAVCQVEADALRAALAATPAAAPGKLGDDMHMRGRKCGEQVTIEFNSARIVTHNPHTGKPRDARDIASDPEGKLIVAPGPLFAAAAPVVLPEPDAVISEVMGLVDEWGMESHLRGEAELDAQHSEATQEEIDCAKDRASKERAAWNAIESKLRALLATATGLPAQAVLDYPWRARLLDGRDLVRDQQGFAEHPELPQLDEGMKPRAFFAALGVEMKHTMADDDLSMDEYDAMSDAENWSAWMPRPPIGDAWNLVAIFDTEDGPAAWWARAQKESQEAEPQAQIDAQDAESDYQRGYRHGYNRRDAEVQGALL